MESEDSLSCSQDIFTDLYPEPEESIPHQHILLLEHLFLYYSWSKSRITKCSLPSSFPMPAKCRVLPIHLNLVVLLT
jgi:hypothetical protein